MKSIISIMIFVFIGNVSYGQPYDFPEFLIEKMLKENDLKILNFWYCRDSSCNDKSKDSEIQFENRRIKNESYFSNENKVFQYFIFRYDTLGRLIQRDFRTDIGNWIFTKYFYNSSKQKLHEHTYTIDKVYNSWIKYKYIDSLLSLQEYIDSGQYWNGEGKDTFEYDNQKRLICIKSIDNYITKYQYDSFGNIIASIGQYIDKPDWEQDKDSYFYLNNRLVKHTREWFNSGHKDEIHIDKTSFEYYENGLLKLLIKESDGEKIYECFTYE